MNISTLINNLHPVSSRERSVVAQIGLINNWLDGYVVTRQSDREFDLHIEGTYPMDSLNTPGATFEVGFGAWLPLSVLRESDWTSDEIWGMVDAYGTLDGKPSDPEYYDWSGIRDSSVEVIWSMFDTALESLMS